MFTIYLYKCFYLLVLLDIVTQKRKSQFPLIKVENFEEIINKLNVRTFAHLMHIIVPFLYPVSTFENNSINMLLELKNRFDTCIK